ncbi:CopD family copper resistance protein [Pseudomonas palleroniana]
MLYLLFLLAHLFAALIFIGTVFFEVLILASLHRQLPARVMVLVEQGVGRRAQRLMPWVLLVLFGAGLGMVWLRYRPVLAAPFASSFGTLLTLKLILAASVLLHFVLTIARMRRGRASAAYLRAVHLSLFGHMVAIVLLAKSMFYLTW